MGADTETLKVYDERVSQYAEMGSNFEPSPSLEKFISSLPQAAYVLDLGCGPGNSALAMINAGMRVDAVDASRAMVEHAQEVKGIKARLARFDEISGVEIYDGIWANFSLLHAAKSDLPGLVATLHAALKKGGLFHIGMKLGEGEERDELGRFYAYYSEEELKLILQNAGFTLIDTRHGSGKGLSGTDAAWITVLSNA